ncbi:MAG: 2-C-methyl-D-erythritol 4-phosphate cytidylyltransferase [Bacilli bacterium]
MNYTVIIPAAGQGKRMGAGVNKLLLPLFGRALFVHTVQRFYAHERCERIVLVVSAEDEKEMQRLLQEAGLTERIVFVQGGGERQQSVHNGLCAIAKEHPQCVLVHDAARPFVQHEEIERLVEKVCNGKSAILATKMKDTIKNVRGSEILSTIDREQLRSALTPQAFAFESLFAAFQHAERENWLGTDEASVMEYYGGKVEVVEGSYYNIKLTTPEDMVYAAFLMEKIFPGNILRENGGAE